MNTLPAVDVVIIGGGWSGLLMAKELGSRSPLNIVVLERGAARARGEYLTTMDELDYAVRLRMMQDPSAETVTLRHDVREKALPIRQFGSFLPGVGIGGAGEHWNGTIPRFLPNVFQVFTSTKEKYGAARLPEEHRVHDWGITYEELEPYYTRAEAMLGAAGKAGNVRGKLIDGGNIFEGRRSAEYPSPPGKTPYFSALFRDAAKSLGYHPYPYPSAIASAPHTNPDGIARPACTYCGFCERFGCMIGAKAQPTNILMPVLSQHNNVAIRTGAWVRRIVHESRGSIGHARGVTYVDANGGEVFQPAELLVLASWTLNNTRLLLLSDIGELYDPATGRGTLGANLTHQVSFSAATTFFDKPLNRFMGSGSAGVTIADFDGDMIDHSKLAWLRGGTLEASSFGNRPIQNFGVVPDTVKSRWGSDWKKAALYYYDRTGSISIHGEHLAYRGNYMDIDPVYKDRFGDPLLRLTLDWRDNERRMAEFMTPKAVEIARAMGAKEISPFRGLRSYNAVAYQTSHVQGGAIMGGSPEHSVVNPHLQHWQVPNLFVLGASSFPNNGSANPTLTVLALTLRSADGIIGRYLKSPALLA
jgi:gluconate 2-dehydrogenase alpha chain